MKQIWKFGVPTGDCPIIEMPEGAEILCVQTQDERPCIWAICDAKEGHPKEVRRFLTAGTGHPLHLKPGSSIKKYIGTFQLASGLLAFHLFELE